MKKVGSSDVLWFGCWIAYIVDIDIGIVEVNKNEM